MANRAYLWNTNVLSNNMFALGSTEDGVDIRRVIVAEAVSRVPVPWMCCFRTLDLQIFAPTRADMFGDDEGDDGLVIAYERLVPCTTVAEAHRNLAASWPLFAAIALDSNEDPEDDARDNACARGLPFVAIVRDEQADLEQLRIRVHELRDALAGGELSLLVLFGCLFSAAAFAEPGFELARLGAELAES